MATRLNEITKNDFFYVIRDDYDEHIELAIPYYWEMHQEIVNYVPRKERHLRVLDLGIGTGKTSAMVLQRFPNAWIRGIDLFEEMLKHARARLAPFAGFVEYIQGDFRETPLGNGYHLCISALAIHHLTGDEKKELFRRIFDALARHGRFLMIDWTKFHSPFVQNLAANVAEHHAIESVPDPEIVRAWCEHWREKNIPDTIEDMRTWLIQAGFSQAECVVRYYGMALICAEKT